MTWKLIDDNEIRSTLNSKISGIVDVVIRARIESIDSIGLMSGKAGIALFLFYYSKITGDKRSDHHARMMISSVFDEINAGKTYYSFAGGLAGIGWTVKHLNKFGLYSSYDDDPLSAIDQFLYNMMMMEIKSANYDYLHGAIGIGLFFLNVLNEKRKRSLNKLINQLDKISIKREGAIYWSSSMRSGDTGYNLGLSHGIASIIAFLGKMIQNNISTDKANQLLSGSLKFLLGNIQDTSKVLSYFPNWAVKEGEMEPSRLAWCYGDLGIGISLFNVSKIIKDKTLEDKAIQILLHSSSRRDRVKNGVVDAGLCHGTAGIAHVFNRLYNSTLKKEFLEASQFWFKETINILEKFNDLSGYLPGNNDTKSDKKSDVGLLEGLSGIGLAMLGAAYDLEPYWDELLLLS